MGRGGGSEGEGDQMFPNLKKEETKGYKGESIDSREMVTIILGHTVYLPLGYTVCRYRAIGKLIRKVIKLYQFRRTI